MGKFPGHKRTILFATSLLLPLHPALAAKKPAVKVPCPKHYEALADMKHAPKPYEFKLYRAPNGDTTIDLKSFRDELLHGITEHNKTAKVPLNPPARIKVYVDNVLQADVRSSKSAHELKLLPDEQYSVRLEALDSSGKVLERTEHRLLEKTAIRSVNPKTYDGEVRFAAHSPFDAAKGIDPELTSEVQKIGRTKVVYVWRNPEDARVKGLQDGGHVDFRIKRDENNRIVGYTATTEAREKKGLPPIDFAKDDAFVKVDAAFNENSFLWDDMFTCLHTLGFDPELCRSTVDFWLNVQKHHSQGLGDIPREVLKSNGTSFNIFETVHLGETLPNGSYTNPNIMGNVVEQLVDQGGLTAENRDLAQRVIESMKQYGSWMDNHRAVKDADGKFAGYWISDLGSGMDNIGRAPGDNFTKVGFVDELARRIELEKSSARLQARLGNFDEVTKHEARAKELDKLMNDRYWSKEQGFYYDLVPGADGKLARQEDMPTVGGFWPLFSRSPNEQQMKQIASKWYTDETFGGSFPVRSLPPIMDKFRPGSYHPEGGYWRGGNWAPTDVMKALGEERMGRPDLAADTINKKLRADTYISNQEVAKGNPKTVYETIGTDPQGNPMPGRQVEPDGRVHQTRKDFVGWSGAPFTFGKTRHSLGIRPVPQFVGEQKDLPKWIETVTKNPLFKNTTHFGESPFRQEAAQQKLFSQGVLEINPPFSIGAEPIELAGYNLHNQPVNITARAVGERNGKKVVEVTLEAKGPIDLNVAFNELGASAGDAPVRALAASRIQKVKTSKGGKTVLELELEPTR